MEKTMKKNMYITESAIACQKLTQHCKSTLLQLKKKTKTSVLFKKHIYKVKISGASAVKILPAVQEMWT